MASVWRGKFHTRAAGIRLQGQDKFLQDRAGQVVMQAFDLLRAPPPRRPEHLRPRVGSGRPVAGGAGEMQFPLEVGAPAGSSPAPGVTTQAWVTSAVRWKERPKRLGAQLGEYRPGPRTFPATRCPTIWRSRRARPRRRQMPPGRRHCRGGQDYSCASAAGRSRHGGLYGGQRPEIERLGRLAARCRRAETA